MDSSTFASVSQSRAKQMNKTSHKKAKHELAVSKAILLERLEKQYGDKFRELRCSNMGTLWKEFVKNKIDAEAFMEIMYPHFPKQIQLAYVHMFERAVRGEIDLDQRLIRDGTEHQATWDPLKDIEQERTEGLLNISNQRLDQLLIDENQK